MSVLPKDSLVLVSGANGFIASHTVDQLVGLGYRVRGTCRSEAKAEWLIEYVENKYGKGKLEIVIIPDMATPGAFDEAVKGTSAFLHIASDVSMNGDPDAVIPAMVRAATSALDAARAEPALRHFVYTSSTAAAYRFDRHEAGADVHADSFADGLADEARRPGPLQGLFVYSASKALAERAVLDYAHDRRPHFVVNTVVPNFNLGPFLAPGKQPASSGSVVPLLYQQGWDGLAMLGGLGPQHYVDVRDTARLHIAPLLDPSIRNERLFAVVDPFTWNDVLAILKKIRPRATLPEPNDDPRRDRYRVHPTARALEVLGKVYGQRAWVGLEECVAANVQHLE